MEAIKHFHSLIRPKGRQGNESLFCLWLFNPLTSKPSDILRITYGNTQVLIERQEDETDIDYVNRAEAEAKKLYDVAMYKDNFAVIEPRVNKYGR